MSRYYCDDCDHTFDAPTDTESCRCACGEWAVREDLADEADADSDVFALIAEIASKLRDATDGNEYHAVGLIYDLASSRTTIADAREELADLTFRHV